MVSTIKVLLVAGARPNFVKVSALVDSIRRHNRQRPGGYRKIDYSLIHTGQHYDSDMSESFFKQLKLPIPDIHLNVGSGTHATQTGRIMIEFEKACLQVRPDVVAVFGDVNSTLACALVAAKLHVPIAHVEAGLRSFDRTMPEEINRVVTDHLSKFLFTTCEDANKNLIWEGIPEESIYFVGNVMIDTLKKHIGIARKSQILDQLGLVRNGRNEQYLLLTLHRPSNVDDTKVLRNVLTALSELSSRMPIIFPMHPRTLKKMQTFNLLNKVRYIDDVRIAKRNPLYREIIGTPPLGYLDFLCLISNAFLVLTDSGGVQEETTILGIPCLTLRLNTERPITLTEGTNFLVGTDPELIRSKARDIIENGVPKKRAPKYWDGKAAKRIVDILTRQLQ